MVSVELTSSTVIVRALRLLFEIPPQIWKIVDPLVPPPDTPGNRCILFAIVVELEEVGMHFECFLNLLLLLRLHLAVQLLLLFLHEFANLLFFYYKRRPVGS